MAVDDQDISRAGSRSTGAGEVIRFHLTSPFRTLLNIHSEQASAFRAASFELIDGALTRAAGDIWPTHSPWNSVRNGFERYATISDDDVTLFAQPLFVLRTPDAIVREAVASLPEQLRLGPVRGRLRAAPRVENVCVRLFDNTVAVATMELRVTLGSEQALDGLLAKVDAFTNALTMRIAALAQDQVRHLIAALLAQEHDMRRAKRLPIDLVRRPGYFRAFADVNFAQTEWEKQVRTDYRWPAARQSHLWTNRVLFVDALDDARRDVICRAWRVPAARGASIPNVPSLEACVNVGNSIFRGPYSHFLEHGLAEVMARMQFFYAQLDIIRDNVRSIYSGLYENVPLKNFRKQREALSRINSQINFIVSELSDHRLGVQGARKWYFEALYECFDVELLVESVRLKQRTVQERVADLQAELFARMDAVIEALIFVLGTLSLIDVSFALLGFSKGGYAPGQAGEWTSGPLAQLRGLSSDLVLVTLAVTIAVFILLYLRRARR